MFWWKWTWLKSWMVEGISGILLGAVLLGWRNVLVRLALGTALSVFYEIALDRNGWSLKDVLERQPTLTVVSLIPVYF